MRVVSLHPDVLVATSRIWQTTCTIVRGKGAGTDEDVGTSDLAHTSVGIANPVVVKMAGEVNDAGEETFLIDSPILPDELEILPALLEQSRFAAPNGLLVTHADWDHLLGRLAFPEASLGCAQASAQRMQSNPGTPQRELRAFDEGHYVQRTRPLTLGSVQALETPGRCEIGVHELELYPADGHTSDGMSIWIGWAGVLVVGDYLSAVEIPVLGEGGSVGAYIQTLGRLRPLISQAAHIVVGHGPILDPERAMAILEEDLAYLSALGSGEKSVEPPRGRRTSTQRHIHAENVKRTLAG